MLLASAQVILTVLCKWLASATLISDL